MIGQGGVDVPGVVFLYDIMTGYKYVETNNP